ncbi:hypothetical protein ZHAS_00007176 [Anopheles sinensis]|uniref:Uncharacterized protein n=1 Tax=Anopheles sinensis TaxID=74873 RepID=A0A084VPB4_ANOSI|nr:hypothetical protein ZHAS_00007176 [Anopheles sinensis]
MAPLRVVLAGNLGRVWLGFDAQSITFVFRVGFERAKVQKWAMHIPPDMPGLEKNANNGPNRSRVTFFDRADAWSRSYVCFNMNCSPAKP